MGRDDPQFNLRLPYELKEKVKQRAKANGRSLNAELVQIVADSLEKPTPVIGYRDDAEREADIVSREIQELVFEKLKDFYRKNSPANRALLIFCKLYTCFLIWCLLQMRCQYFRQCLQ